MTEEKNESTKSAEGTEESLAQEALKATETPAEKPETVPVGVVKELREDRRELRGQVSQLTELLATRSTEAAPAEEKSPIDLYVEEYGEDQPIDAKTYRKQQKWEKDKADKKAAKDAVTKRKETVETSHNQALIDFSVEKVGEGLDLDSVLAMGRKYLTKGDGVDIAEAGDRAWKVAYKKCKRAILDSETADAKELQRRIDAHKKKPQPEPENKEGGPEAKPEGKKEPPSQEAILDPHLANVFGP